MHEQAKYKLKAVYLNYVHVSIDNVNVSIDRPNLKMLIVKHLTL